jgi:hypothetical protein
VAKDMEKDWFKDKKKSYRNNLITVLEGTGYKFRGNKDSYK